MDIMADSCEDRSGSFLGDNQIKIVFVLGGPGSGKGTQCAKIVEHFGFTHLSAGDLLREEAKSVSEYGAMMNEGKIIPAEVTAKLLQRAMIQSGNDKFLIDGFPRDEDNRVAFENLTNMEPDFVLFFDCPEKELERRILNRNQGREDDNILTMRKRFKVFAESTIPVVEYYDKKGKVRKVNAAKPIDEVFEDVKLIFAPFISTENCSSTPSIRTCMGLNYVVRITIRLYRAARKMMAYILSKIFFWN